MTNDYSKLKPGDKFEIEGINGYHFVYEVIDGSVYTERKMESLYKRDKERIDGKS